MRLVLSLAFVAALIAAPALAQDSVTHASAGLDATGLAVDNFAASGIQTVGGVSAVPLGLAGGLVGVAGLSVAAGGLSVAVTGASAAKAADDILAETWGPLKVDAKVVLPADPAPQVPYTAKKSAAR